MELILLIKNNFYIDKLYYSIKSIGSDPDAADEYFYLN